jgi:hypothetical protein
LGYRISGLLLRSKPDAAGLSALERAYGYKLFELAAGPLWLLDLGVTEPAPGSLTVVKAARPLASSYVDALRVIGADEEPLEQLVWLAAAEAAAHLFRQPVMAFLSDDETYDFAAVVSTAGVTVIGDRLRSYLLRWEKGTLAIQPFYYGVGGAEPPEPPDELALIPKTSMHPTEKLPTTGYPLHGNVLAELATFAPEASSLGMGTWTVGPLGSLNIIEAKRLGHSCWDRATGATLRTK